MPCMVFGNIIFILSYFMGVLNEYVFYKQFVYMHLVLLLIIFEHKGV